MNSQTNIEGLLGKPLWQMTGEEYCQLTQYALSLSPNTGSSSPSPPGQKALGVHALAVELGCSDSTVYSLMRTPREEDGSADAAKGYMTAWFRMWLADDDVAARVFTGIDPEIQTNPSWKDVVVNFK